MALPCHVVRETRGVRGEDQQYVNKLSINHKAAILVYVCVHVDLFSYAYVYVCVRSVFLSFSSDCFIVFHVLVIVSVRSLSCVVLRLSSYVSFYLALLLFISFCCAYRVCYRHVYKPYRMSNVTRSRQKNKAHKSLFGSSLRFPADPPSHLVAKVRAVAFSHHHVR